MPVFCAATHYAAGRTNTESWGSHEAAISRLLGLPLYDFQIISDALTYSTIIRLCTSSRVSP